MPPAIPDKIPCDTEQQLQRELDDLRNALDQDETEETWEKMLRALTRCKSLLRGGAYRHESFVPGIKAIGGLLSKPLLSERGRLSAAAIELLSTLASALGRRFEPLMHLFAPPLMKLCQRPNKVVINRTTACITIIIQHTRVPSILIYLRDAVKDKSVQLRTVASEAALLCVTQLEAEKIGSRVADIEVIMKVAGRDANPEVRKNARSILRQYQEKWPERYQTFISPLSPLSRKYLDVQSVAILAKEPAPSLNLFPSTTKTASNTQSGPLKAVRSQVTAEKSLLSHGISSRPPSRTARAPVAIEGSLPPRPHSVASMGPRQQPISRNVMGSTMSVLKNEVLPRPLSVDVAQLATLWPKDPPKESQGGQLRTQGGSNQGKGLQRYQSRENLVQKPHLVETSDYTGNTAASNDRQRSDSAFSRREEVEKPVRVPATSYTSNMEPSAKVEEYNRTRTISSSRRQVADFFQPPRPPSRANDNQAFVRPSSRAATNSKDDDANRVPPSRPISMNVDSIAPSKSNEGNGTTFPVVSQSRTGPESRTPFHTAPKPIPLPSQTPRSAVERPTVVYLPTAESVAVERPRPVKTWSLSHQLELLKKRKKAAEQQAGEPKEPLDVAFADTGLINEVGFPTSASDTPPEQEIEPPQSIYPLHGQVQIPQSIDDPENSRNPVQELPVAFPSSEEMDSPSALAFPTQATGHSTHAEASSHQIAVAPSSLHPTVFEKDRPEVLGPTLTHSDPPVRQRVTSTTSVASAPPARPKVALNSSKPPVTRQRVISTSSNPALPSKEKQALEVPSRGPVKATGFVPKRTTKNSITQPTKSQAARVQAVLNEKATASQVEKVKTALAGRNAQNPQKTAPAFAPIPVSHKGTAAGLTEPQNSRPAQTKDAKDFNGPTISKSVTSTNSAHATNFTDSTNSTSRFRPESRKPPVPTVSSLVKTHAARREAALASVAAKNGKSSELAGSVVPKIKPAARGPPRQPKPIRKMVNPSDRSASTSVTGYVGNAGAEATGQARTDTISGVVPSSKQLDGKGLHLSTSNNQNDENDEVIEPYSHVPPSRPKFQPEKLNTRSGLDSPTVAERTLPLPLPSSPFGTTDETPRAKFKPVRQSDQGGETYISPNGAKNVGGAILLNELRAG